MCTAVHIQKPSTHGWHGAHFSISMLLGGVERPYDLLQSSNTICISEFHSSLRKKSGKRLSVLTDLISLTSIPGPILDSPQRPLRMLSSVVLNRHTLYPDKPWILSVWIDKGGSAHPGLRQMFISLFTGIALLASSPHINWILIVMFRADASLLAKFSLCG